MKSQESQVQRVLTPPAQMLVQDNYWASLRCIPACCSWKSLGWTRHATLMHALVDATKS